MRMINGRLTRTYRKWSSMIQRCTNPKHIAFRFYGGTGVVVCERWRSSYDAFEQDMGEAPPGMWLDRIDNAKGYEPGNCRWVTPSQSANNRRQRGPAPKPGSLADLARKAGLPYAVVYQRVKKHFWTLERALSEPVFVPQPQILETQSQAQVRRRRRMGRIPGWQPRAA